jgi:transposase InsO family protein
VCSALRSGPRAGRVVIDGRAATSVALDVSSQTRVGLPRAAVPPHNYNRRRRHSVCGMKSPIDYEAVATVTARAA